MHANRGFAPHRGLLQSGAGRRRWLRSSVSSSDTQQKRWNRDDAQNAEISQNDLQAGVPADAICNGFQIFSEEAF